MIDANELRIGSLFYPINRTGKVHLPQEIPYRVLTLHTFHLEGVQPHENPALFDKVPIFRYEDISPIRLTPEILLQCGVTYDPCIDTFRCRGIYFAKEFPLSQEYRMYIPTGGSTYFFHKPMKYLHELQNAIFALNGEELPVNLTANQPA